MRFGFLFLRGALVEVWDNESWGLRISGGASPSRQPGHFQVTKVVRQVTVPFPPPFSSLPLTPLHSFLSPSPTFP